MCCKTLSLDVFDLIYVYLRMYMKRLWVFLFLLLAFSCKKADILGSSSGAGEPARLQRLLPVLPQDGGIPEVRILVKESDWKTLLDAYNKDHDTQLYIPCGVSYVQSDHRESVELAGLRLKGNTSRRYPGEAGKLHHVHFGLDLDAYQEEGRLLGSNRLDLKWFKDDPAYCREVFCYDLFQRFGVWTALTSGYVRLWVRIGSKETYMGVYQLMEHVRKDYLKRRNSLFQGSAGHLWKASYGASFRDAGASMGADDNKGGYTYELKSDPSDFVDAKAQLQTFIRRLTKLSGEEFYAWADTTMDVPLLLKTYAVNVTVGMWDDYWNNTNNFYFYFNPAGKFFFIPYDYDNTLGTSLQCGVQQDAGRQSPLNWGSKDNPLIVKLLARPQWKQLYISYLKELCQGDFRADVAMARIKEWQQAIGPYVSNDTGEDMSIEDRPASWGNHGEYRLLKSGSNNFFQVKAGVILAL